MKIHGTWDERFQLGYSTRLSAPQLLILLEISSICPIEQYGPWLIHTT